MKTGITATPIKILLVEHIWAARVGIRVILSNDAGRAWDILEAPHLEEALSLLAQHVFDLAIVDLDFSPAGTEQGLRALRGHGLSVPMVVLSDRTDRGHVFSCIRAGACGYVHKVMGDPDALLAAVDAVLRGGVFIPASVVGSTASEDARRQLRAQASAEIAGALNGRHREVLRQVCRGLSNKDIATSLNLSEATIRKTYVTHLLRAFQVKRRTELMALFGGFDEVDIGTLGRTSMQASSVQGRVSGEVMVCASE